MAGGTLYTAAIVLLLLLSFPGIVAVGRVVGPGRAGDNHLALNPGLHSARVDPGGHRVPVDVPVLTKPCRREELAERLGVSRQAG
jgi:hypothetical protein